MYETHLTAKKKSIAYTIIVVGFSYYDPCIQIFIMKIFGSTSV